ncbi:MAG: TetR/AcrR family transcriptional regulator [Myxococcota bacterium]
MRKGEETRRQIVERALALAGEVGLEGVTLGTLAAALDLSKSGLFAHFRSKEALQLQVLERAVERFVDAVVRPALLEPRGEPRVRELFERYLAWIRRGSSRGGCLFMSLSNEYDDRPGVVRDRLVRSQKEWLSTLARAASLAVDEEQFRADLDCEQLAYEVLGIGMAFQHAHKLLGDPRAEKRARVAFSDLLSRAVRRTRATASRR